MDFIKKMKKREFIEMGLKTLAAILAAFLAIILMEGMIYSIYLNDLKTNPNRDTYTTTENHTIAYCIKEGEDKYFVIYYNDNPNSKGLDRSEWSAKHDEFLTKQECLDLQDKNVTKAYVKDVVFKAPNAFDFSISSVHYIVMAVFVAAVGGFFTYKFIALSKEYQKIEKEYKEKGTISFN